MPQNLIDASLWYSLHRQNLVLTRTEKDELVKQLYEEGKTVREIAKVAHISFTVSRHHTEITGERNKDSNNKSS
jgi:DNA-binding NarL/FixJ family response regulator